MKFLTVILCFAVLSGCVTVGSLQRAAEPYNVELSGNAEGVLGANLRYIAIDGTVGGTLRFRKESVVLWSQEIQQGSGQKAFLIVFDEDDQFIDVVPTTWEAARASMPWLPIGD